MEKRDKITAGIKEWLDKNRDSLPLNIDSWDMKIRDEPERKIIPLSLGRHNAQIIQSLPFYKPFSKIYCL